MRYYPVQLDIQNRPCLVVGGGSVGTRKACTLLQCGALVNVVTITATDELQDLAQKEKIHLRIGPYAASDMEQAFLVIGATNDETLNQRISQDARQMGKLCNIADRPEFCNFILPSIVQRGDLVIAISTSGKSPAFAKRLRKEIQAQFGPEYADFLELMGRIREKLLSQAHEPEAHKHLFEKLIDGGLLDSMRNKNIEEADRLLNDVLGEGFVFDTLTKPDK
jgi:precorrin-2 dehydrogenase/sirohydrochlorin ferrochelatase